MIFLPIVERELRVAARKRGTVWLRVLTALVALVIGAGFLTMSLAVGVSTTRFGSGLFGTVTWLALAAALGAGLFFTADSLSEEKREGTLGFLFLTDLRGYDVVGGKLLATSLRGSYALLALFPVLAVTLLMGGITGTQFSKSSLALVNALFCSLATGLLVSSVCRDSQKTMAGTFFLLLLVCAGGPLFDASLAISRQAGFKPVLSLVSPVYVFWAASAWGKTGYWLGLAASHLLAWVWFAAASLLVTRTWQDRSGRTAASSVTRTYSWRYGATPVRDARRKKLMDPNPVLWLALRERWQPIGAWVLAILVLCPFVAILLTLPSMVWIIWSQVNGLVLLVLYLWTASQACRFLVDARRSGLLELLLVTPLSSRDVISGHWRGLLRMFGFPAALLLLVQVAGSIFAQRTRMGMLTPNAGAFAPSAALNVLVASVGALGSALNLGALMWFGMWMGLTSKNVGLATLKALLFVQVLPWMGISFVSTTIAGLLMFQRTLASGTPPNSMLFAFPFLMMGLSGVLSLAKDVAFIVWARQRLYTSFRSEAGRIVNTVKASNTATRRSEKWPPTLGTEVKRD